MIGVNAGDGNNLFTLAKRIQRMGLEELRKTPPDEMRANIRNGTETGSTKFLSDFNSFYGLANQLRVKTKQQSVELNSIRQITEYERVQYINTHSDRFNRIKARTKEELYRDPFPNMYELKKRLDEIVNEAIGQNNLEERQFILEAIALVWDSEVPSTKGMKSREELKKMKKEVFEDIVRYKEGAPDSASQKLIFNTLAKTDSSIANLIQNLTSSNESLFTTLKSKRSVWTTEINNEKLEALKQDAISIKGDFESARNTPEIANYKDVFDRLTKRYDDLYLLIKGIDSGSTMSVSKDRANINFNPPDL